MLVNSASKAYGRFCMASASVEPASTSTRTWSMAAASRLSGSSFASSSRHCTSGRPASIMTENCRVKIARLRAETRR